MKDDFSRVAIVNRGEPAVRFIRAVRDYNRLHRTSIETLAFCAPGDRRARFAREADDAVDLQAHAEVEGSAGPRRSPYLDYGVLERALVATRADAAWAGWGFVSEQPVFADLCARLGITFIGPPAAAKIGRAHV